MISVKLTETVEYCGVFDRDDVINILAQLPDVSTDSDYAEMSDQRLAAEFLAELKKFGKTSDSVYETIERNNRVVENRWDLS